MSQSESAGGVKEAVGVFGSAGDFQEAIDELLSSGFDRADLSLLAGEKTVEKKLGHVYRRAADAENDQSIPRLCYISPEAIGDAQGALVGGLFYVGAVAAVGMILATGGAVATAIAGAAVAGGTGGLIGSVLAKLVGDHHAAYLQNQLDHGGLLLWVRTPDSAHEAKAVAILKKHSGQDVHVHALP